MGSQNDISLTQWLDKLLAHGRYGFSIDTLKQDLPDYSDIAVKRALGRLSKKRKIVSLYKGYYLIITPQYASKGILPPQLYLDSFMNYLKRPYYVALINAAAFHGASHQQPQEYFVMTGFPVLRPTQKRGLKINYISIRNIPDNLIEKTKTIAGYLNISNPVLTACDLVQFEKRIGGINRAATVLNELIEVLKPADFSTELFKHVHITVLQRLGYILEYECFNMDLSSALYEAMKKEGLNLFRTALKPGKDLTGYSSNNRWKIVVNAEIDIDD